MIVIMFSVVMLSVLAMSALMLIVLMVSSIMQNGIIHAEWFTLGIIVSSDIMLSATITF